MPTVETEILGCFVKGVRRKLTMSDEQVYPVIAPAYVDGSDPDTIQASFGSVAPHGGGEGYQEGGALQKKGVVTLTYFKRLLMDQHGTAEEMLTVEGQGLLEVFGKIRDVFAMTVLGGWVLEPVSYLGESVTAWEDADKGLARRDVQFGVVWAESRPTELTLTAQDLA